MNYKTEAEPKAWADGVPVFCAHDAIVDVTKLIPNPKNPNQHPDSQIQLLGRIIRQTGWRQPITVSRRSGFIVKGHGRLSAALLEGMKEAPVDYQNYATEAEEYADLVADNRLAELAETDNELLADIFADIDTGEIPMEMTGYTDDEVENLITALSEAIHDDSSEPDDIPETPEPDHVVTQKGDLWILGRHRLMCGDSTEQRNIERLMDDKKADMVFTDPPYGIAIVKGNKVGGGGATHFGTVGGGKIVKSTVYSDIIGDETVDTARAFYEACTKIGYKNYIIFGGNYFTEFLPPKACWLVWDKQNTGNFADVELAWTSFDSAAKLYQWMWNGLARQGDRKTEGAHRVHPTQKPVGLIANILKDFTKENDEVVFDGFGGSGSTLIACEQLGKTCHMMELDPKYCDVIVRRYIKVTGKTDIRLIRNGQELDRGQFEEIFAEQE